MAVGDFCMIVPDSDDVEKKPFKPLNFCMRFFAMVVCHFGNV